MLKGYLVFVFTFRVPKNLTRFFYFQLLIMNYENKHDLLRILNCKQKRTINKSGNWLIFYFITGLLKDVFFLNAIRKKF